MIPEEIKNTEENILRYRERINNFSKEFELGLFIYLLSKVKWIIVLVFLTSLSVSLIYLRYTPNKYKTSTTIQLNIKKQNDDFLDIYSYQQQTNLNSEVELLKSQIIIDKLIKSLKLDKIYYSEGEILTRNLYKSSPFEIKNNLIKDSSIIGKYLYLKIKDKYLSLTNEDESITYAEYIQPNNYFSSDYFSGELEIKQSFEELNKTLEDSKYYLVFPSLQSLRSEIRNGIEISILDYSANTINISYRHSNPKFAQDVCNSIAKEYLNYDLEKKAISSVNIVEFINAQKDSVEIRLKASEREIQGFKKLNNVNSSNILKTSNISQLDEIDKRILEIKLEISMMERFTNKFNQTLSTEINSASINSISLTQIFYNDEFILNMVEVLKEDLGKRDGLLRDITVNNENIILINNKIEQQIISIKNALEIIKEQKQKLIVQLEQKIRNLEIKLLSLPEKELELTRLERVHGINNKYFTLLLEKETEYELSKAGITTYNEILQPANLNETPISPTPIFVHLICTIIGLLISVLIATINYLLHDKITSLFEISKYSSGTIGILGMIPMMRNKVPISPLIVDKSPKSMITESFRAIRTNLQFITNDKDAKIIAISSTISGEGKTFLAINLAGIIAFTGKKVVILDLDMRKPKIHRGFGIKNNVGMSDILAGKNKFNECINHSELKGLDFITAGTLPPNPSELIVSDLFTQTMEDLKNEYDMIVVDNPPVGLVTDGIPVLQKADYPIYVFKANFSRKNFVQNVDRLINENKLNKLSVVLNGVDINSSGYGSKYGNSYYSDDNINKKSIFERIKSFFKLNESSKN